MSNEEVAQTVTKAGGDATKACQDIFASKCQLVPSMLYLMHAASSCSRACREGLGQAVGGARKALMLVDRRGTFK